MPRGGRGSAEVPPSLRTSGITSREMDVLLMVAEGKTNAEIAERLYLMDDPEVGASRIGDSAGITVAVERWKAPLDTRPLYRGLPDDSCQAHHWGYLTIGKFRMFTKDGEEVVTAGHPYYLPPGHNVMIEEDVEMIEFTPAEERIVTMDHLAKVLAEQG